MENLRFGPGLIDIHINGSFGADFNRVPAEQVIEAIHALPEHGLVACCPTIITDEPQAMLAALGELTKAREQDWLVAKMVPGFHIEGPFISPVDGPRGAHPACWVRLPDYNEVQRWQEVTGGLVKIVTIAPELSGAIPLIEKMARDGIVVGLGHSDTASEESKLIIDDAVGAGARLATHLWNGTFRQHARHLGGISRLLWDARVMATFIVDGYHIHQDVIKLSLRTKGISRSILVSDAISGAGLSDGSRCRLGDLELVVKNGAFRLPGDDVLLAGSALTLDQAVMNAVKFGSVSFDEAFLMASVNPAHLLDLESTLIDSRLANGICYRFNQWQKTIVIEMTIIGGEVVYQKNSMRKKEDIIDDLYSSGTTD